MPGIYRNSVRVALLTLALFALPLQAQTWDLASELELGAVYTSGNTDNESLRFRAAFDAIREQWSYRLTLDGFRSSKDDELAA